MGTKIGCLWNKTLSNGRDVLTGFVTIDGVSIKLILWPNDRKRGPSSPDFQIYINDWTPRDGKNKDASDDGSEGRPIRKSTSSEASLEGEPEEVGGFSDDDVPF